MVLGRVVFGDGDLRPADHFRRVEQAEAEPRGQQAAQRGVDLRFGDQPLADGRHQGAVFHAAAHVAAGLDRPGDGLFSGGDFLVVGENVEDRPAVRNDVPLEAPLLAKEVLQEQRAGAAGLAVDAVVSPHDRPDLPLADRRLEVRKIRLVEIAIAGGGVEGVPRRLRAAVDREMLGAGHRLGVLRVVALEAADEGHGHPRSEEGVFAVGLLAAAPARVAEDVDVRRPKRQPRVLGRVAVVGPRVLVVLGPGLGRDRVGHVVHERRVPGGRQADRLGKHGGHAGSGHAVEAFVPIVVGGRPSGTAR